jgi:hypothetical protein
MNSNEKKRLNYKVRSRRKQQFSYKVYLHLSLYQKVVIFLKWTDPYCCIIRRLQTLQYLTRGTIHNRRVIRCLCPNVVSYDGNGIVLQNLRCDIFLKIKEKINKIPPLLPRLHTIPATSATSPGRWQPPRVRRPPTRPSARHFEIGPPCYPRCRSLAHRPPSRLSRRPNHRHRLSPGRTLEPPP